MDNNVKINPISVVLIIFIALLAVPYPLQALMPIGPDGSVGAGKPSRVAPAPAEEPEGGKEAGAVDYKQAAPARRDVTSESGLGTEGEGTKEIKKEKQRILEKVKRERPQVKKRPFETDLTMRKGPVLLQPEVEKEGSIEFMNRQSTKRMFAGFIFLIGLYLLYKYLLRRLKNNPE